MPTRYGRRCGRVGLDQNKRASTHDIRSSRYLSFPEETLTTAAASTTSTGGAGRVPRGLTPRRFTLHPAPQFSGSTVQPHLRRLSIRTARAREDHPVGASEAGVREKILIPDLPHNRARIVASPVGQGQVTQK